MHRALRVPVALALGLAAGLFVVFVSPGGDGLWPLHGARRLLAGSNPYAAAYPELTSDPAYLWLYYPLPALAVFVPVVWLPDRVALGIVTGLACTALGYAVWPRPHLRLVFLSQPLLAALWYVNPFPIAIAAALLLPWLAPLAACKPTIGLTVASRPRRLPRWGMAIALLSIAASIPLGWLAHAGQHVNTIAVTTLPGALAVLLMLPVARDASARLVLLTAVVPLRIVDPIGLCLAPATWPGAIALLVASWAIWILLPDPTMPALILAAALVAQAERLAARRRLASGPLGSRRSTRPTE